MLEISRNLSYLCNEISLVPGVTDQANYNFILVADFVRL
jgi:hypothetical protein